MLLPSSRSQRGGGSPDLVKVACYGGWRSIGTGRLGPQTSDGCRRRRRFFFLVGMICWCCSSSSSALMLEGDSALPGRMARPRCWTGRMTRVLFLPEGTFFAVLKVKDGDGCCRCVGLMSMPSQRWCQERRKQRGGNCSVVEDDDLFATGCRSFCCRGLLSRFRDDDTGLRRSSCVMVVLGYSKCLWSFVFAFQCACKGHLLCTDS